MSLSDKKELEPIEDVVKRDLSGWAESLYNCTTGKNYLRASEYYRLIRALDNYAREKAELQQLFGAACLQLQGRGDKEVTLVSTERENNAAPSWVHPQDALWIKYRVPGPEGAPSRIYRDAFDDLMAELSARSAIGARWVPTSERQPDRDGRLWSVLTDKMTNGRLVGFYPLYEYYHFDNGWATDERIMYWLDVEIPKLPSASTDGKADSNG